MAGGIDQTRLDALFTAALEAAIARIEKDGTFFPLVFELRANGVIQNRSHGADRLTREAGASTVGEAAQVRLRGLQRPVHVLQCEVKEEWWRRRDVSGGSGGGGGGRGGGGGGRAVSIEYLYCPLDE